MLDKTQTVYCISDAKNLWDLRGITWESSLPIYRHKCVLHIAWKYPLPLVMAATCSFSKLLGMASFLGHKKLGKSSWIKLPWTNLNRSNMIQSHSQMIGVISMGFHHQAGHPHRYIVTCQGWNDWTTCVYGRVQPVQRKNLIVARFKNFNSSCICSSCDAIAMYCWMLHPAAASCRTRAVSDTSSEDQGSFPESTVFVLWLWYQSYVSKFKYMTSQNITVLFSRIVISQSITILYLPSQYHSHEPLFLQTYLSLCSYMHLPLFSIPQLAGPKKQQIHGKISTLDIFPTCSTVHALL